MEISMTDSDSPRRSDIEWYALVDGLLLDCAAAVPAETEGRLRAAFQVLSQAPARIQSMIGSLPKQDLFEVLLTVGAYESAALTFMGAEMGYMVSSGPNGAYLASVILPGMTEDASAEGENLALALLAALAAALLHHERKSLATKPVPAAQNLRIH